MVGIRGNFDDAQTGVKKMFGDRKLGEELAKGGFQFSSAIPLISGVWFPRSFIMFMPARSFWHPALWQRVRRLT